MFYISNPNVRRAFYAAIATALLAVVVSIVLAVTSSRSSSGQESRIATLEAQLSAMNVTPVAEVAPTVVPTMVPTIQTPVATATTQVAALPTATAADSDGIRYDIELNFNESYASLFGDDSVNLVYEVVESEFGVYENLRDAVDAMHSTSLPIRQACYDKRDVSNSTGQDYYRTSSTNGSTPFSEECIDLLEALFNSTLVSSVDSDLLQEMSWETNLLAENLWLFDVKTNEFLGVWLGNLPSDISESSLSECFERSLGYNYTGEGVYFVDRRDSHVSDTLWAHGWTNISYRRETLPDFCESANLVEVAKPSWVTYTRLDSDEIYFEASNGYGHKARFSIHTDAENCNIYTNEWPQDRFLFSPVFTTELEDGTVVFDQIPYVSLEFGDLIMIERIFAEEFVYLTVTASGEIKFYEPIGPGYNMWGDISLSYQHVPTARISPMSDGIENLYYASGNPGSSFWLDGSRQLQSEPVFYEGTLLSPAEHEGHNH